MFPSVQRKKQLGDRTIADEEITNQAAMLAALIQLPTGTAIGVCLSYLLHCAYNHHEIFRRVINEKVVQQGFVGESMISVLTRLSRS